MFKLLAISALAISFSAIPAFAQSQTVRNVQQALRDKGYNPGPVDGLDGPHTRSALRQYQRHEELTVNGDIDASTLSHLGIRPTPGEQFSSATTSTAKYKKAGHQYANGGKTLVKDSSKGYVGAGVEGFGKDVGKGTKNAAVGTAHAAEHVGKGVKDAITEKPKNNNNNDNNK